MAKEAKTKISITLLQHHRRHFIMGKPNDPVVNDALLSKPGADMQELLASNLRWRRRKLQKEEMCSSP